MKKTLNIIFLVSSMNLFAQQQTIGVSDNDISTLRNTVEKQKTEIKLLDSKLSNQMIVVNQQKNTIKKLSVSVDSIRNLTNTNSTNINVIANDLGTKIQQTGQKSETQISKLGTDVEKNRLYWIIATLVTLLLGGLVYWLLGKRIASSQTDVETQIRNTKKSLEEESLKLDAQLLDIINSQLKIKETQVDNKSENGEKDHSLVLKVADEVTRILMNLEVMDKEIKGYKHLKKYSESILDNLKAYGYEIPQLIGMNYNSGMNMVATLEFDDTIESGKQIIKRIIKPQVNFEGKVIQTAKVTVAFNE
nr:hypothetical protein [uncultured Flavobacterium sp.]